MVTDNNGRFIYKSHPGSFLAVSELTLDPSEEFNMSRVWYQSSYANRIGTATPGTYKIHGLVEVGIEGIGSSVITTTALTIEIWGTNW